MDDSTILGLLSGNSKGLIDLRTKIETVKGFLATINEIDSLQNLDKRFYEETRSLYQATSKDRTIEALEAISRTYGTPRDALVEYSVQKLGSIISAEQLRHEERKNLQRSISDHFTRGKMLYKKAVVILGEDDPYCRRIAKAIFACQKTEEELADFINKSKVLENF